jgi:hypothetical protein
MTSRNQWQGRCLPRQYDLPRHRKQRGELAELKFATRAAELGLIVSKPLGDCQPFDFIVCNLARFWRVQVKSSVRFFCDAWAICAMPSDKRPYRSAELDLMACYIFPVDTWYLIPSSELRGRTGLRLYPHRPADTTIGGYEPFREAWHVFERNERS